MTKRKVRRFTVERRVVSRAFAAIGQSGRGGASIGFDRTVPEQCRRRDAALALECCAALEEAGRRLPRHAYQCEVRVKFWMPEDDIQGGASRRGKCGIV